MTSAYYPVRRDRRYTVTLEWCGYERQRYVVRFCDEFIASFETKSGAFMRAVGEHQVRMGALVVTEQK